MQARAIAGDPRRRAGVASESGQRCGRHAVRSENGASRRNEALNGGTTRRRSERERRKRPVRKTPTAKSAFAIPPILPPTPRDAISIHSVRRHHATPCSIERTNVPAGAMPLLKRDQTVLSRKWVSNMIFIGQIAPF